MKKRKKLFVQANMHNEIKLANIRARELDHREFQFYDILFVSHWYYDTFHISICRKHAVDVHLLSIQRESGDKKILNSKISNCSARKFFDCQSLLPEREKYVNSRKKSIKASHRHFVAVAMASPTTSTLTDSSANSSSACCDAASSHCDHSYRQVDVT